MPDATQRNPTPHINLKPRKDKGMAEPNKEDKEITTQVNAEEASYLQSLGLKTLLSQKLTKPVQRFWFDLINVNSKAWPSVTLFFVLLFAMSAIVLTLSANSPKVADKCETCSQKAAGEGAKLQESKTEFIATQSRKPQRESNNVIDMSHDALGAFFSKASPSDLNGRHPVHGGSVAHSLVRTNPDVSLLQAFCAAGGNLNQHRFTCVDNTWDRFKKGDTPLMLCIRRGDIKTTLKLLKHFTPAENGLWRRNVHNRTALDLFLFNTKKLKENGASEDQMAQLKNFLTASAN